MLKITLTNKVNRPIVCSLSDPEKTLRLLAGEKSEPIDEALLTPYIQMLIENHVLIVSKTEQVTQKQPKNSEKISDKDKEE